MFHRMLSIPVCRNMYVNSSQTSYRRTTSAGTKARLVRKSSALLARRTKKIKNIPMFAISNHFKPTGNRLEGIYRFT